MWTRIKALHDEGVELHIICWTSQKTTDSQINTLRKHCSELSIFNRNISSLLNVITNPQYPVGVATHVVNRKNFLLELEKVKAFNPDALVVDGIYGAVVALDLASHLKLPIFYRSHNVEYQHMLDQVKSSSSWFKKLRYLVDAPRMYKLERILRQECYKTYDICEQDSKFWHALIGIPSQVLQPLIQEHDTINQIEDSVEQSIDILYIGNLHNPNNLNGLRWFILQVLPYVYTKRKVRVVLAGSNPNAELIQLSKAADIEVIENPPTLGNLYASAKVLINPILHVSGINIKTVEMLSTGKPLVASKHAVRGISSQISSLVKIANTEGEFAEAILDILSKPTALNERQQALIKQEFGKGQVLLFLKDLENLVNRS